MDGLSDKQIMRLLKKRGRQSKSRTVEQKIWVRQDGEIFQLPQSEVPKEAYGYFVGKAGSIKRSRKGTPRRQANGRRYYEVARGCESQAGTLEVISYPAPKVVTG